MGNWWDTGGTAGGDSTYGPNNKNAGAPGYDINGRPLASTGLPDGFVIGRNGELIPPGTGNTAGPGIPVGKLFDIGGTVYRWNGKTITKASVADTKTYRGEYSLDPASETGYTDATSSATGGVGGSGANTQLEYDRLAAQYMNMGLDAESARRQALTTLITNRNNLSSDVANTSANVAKTAAEFAANPRDAVAELMYRNQVGGTTPFGDMTSKNFGEYGKALADKASSIFSPVQADLQQARVYRDSIAPLDFLGSETRSQLGLQPTAAQALTGAPTGVTSPPVASPTAPDTNVLTQLTDRLKSMSPEEQAAFRKWTVPGYAKGGSIDFEGMFANRDKPGASPSSSEGGTNLNIHERAVIMGESGQIYATLGEKRPDGSIRSEQLQIKPLKSEVEKDKKLEEGHKAIVESQKQTMKSFAGGGTATATPDDFMMQLKTYLGSLGGAGGGTGSFGTPLPSLRLLAGAPAEQLANDPVAQDYALAGYSALGIDPRTVQSTLAKYTPASAQRVGQTAPRVNYL